MSLNTVKTTDVPILKNLKSPPGCVKLAFGAMCILLGVAPEKIPEAQAKKNVTISLSKLSYRDCLIYFNGIWSYCPIPIMNHRTVK